MNSATSSTGRSLRLVVRDDDRGRSRSSNDNGGSSNLFARLSPGVARDLCQRSLREDHHKDDDDTNNVNLGSSWMLPSTDDTATVQKDDIQFLPLKINVRERDGDGNDTTVHTIYASFNGGIARNNEQDGIGTFLNPPLPSLFDARAVS